MKFDNIIIGGGLSGIIAGLSLLKAGKSVAIVSSGHSSLHFNSGSISLLGHDDYGDIQRPLDGIECLSPEHPYNKIGLERLRKYMPKAKNILAEAGINMKGEDYRNQYRLTPLGLFKPVWLTAEGYASFPAPGPICKGVTLIVNIKGFLDFYPEFIARGLTGEESECIIKEISHPKIEMLRKNTTEMRASNIARILDKKSIKEIAQSINQLVASTGAHAVVMPGVIGNYVEPLDAYLRKNVDCPVYYVASMPISVCGMNAQMKLQRHFTHLGGQYLLGDTVESGKFENGKLKSIFTKNLGDTELKADNFILASGSFISHGLIATPDKILEPLFSLDVDAPADRKDWCEQDVYGNHAYMSAGLKTDGDFRVFMNGSPISNLHAIGAILGNCNPYKEESGGGIAILTAMTVADIIIRKGKEE